MLCPAEAGRHRDVRQVWLRESKPSWLNQQDGWSGPMLDKQVHNQCLIPSTSAKQWGCGSPPCVFPPSKWMGFFSM